jgi:hypothetical protein
VPSLLRPRLRLEGDDNKPQDESIYPKAALGRRYVDPHLNHPVNEL